MPWLAGACKLIVSRFWNIRDDRKAIANGSFNARLICAVIYWYLWIVLIPRWRGYRIEEKADILEDGTSVMRLVRIKGDSQGSADSDSYCRRVQN